MCMYPNHETFRKHIKIVADGLDKGIYDTYNHADSRCCVVGLAIADMTSQPVDSIDSDKILAHIENNHLNTLYNRWFSQDPRDQAEGAQRARAYLAATADLETV